MPMYEYRCKECGEAFEKLTSFSSQAQVTCPKCGGKRVEKQISGFACCQSSTSSSSAGSCAPRGGG